MSNVRNPRVSQALTPPIVSHPTEGRSALAQGVVDVATIGANMAAENIAGNLQEELYKEQEEFLSNPDNFVEDDPLMNLDPDSKNAAKTFAEVQARLQDAADQGTVPITELKIRQERILRDYMKRYPKLVPLFQRAATGVLGYNPIGSEISAIQQSNAMRQSQVAAIYDRVIKAADSAGVNPMLQLTNPDAYWSRVSMRLEEADVAAKLDRDLKTAEAMDKLNSREARRIIRSGMSGLTAAALDTISPIINQFSQMPAGERATAAAQGMFDSARDALVQGRSQFVTEFYNDYFVNSDMTPEQLEAELKPVLDVFDYAIQNISDEKLMDKVNQLHQVSKSEFFLRHPDLARLNYMADILSSPTMAAAVQANRELQTEMGKIVSSILSQSHGGAAVPGSFLFPDAVTNGTTNPAASRARLPTIEEMGGAENAAEFFDLHLGLTAASLDEAYRAEGDRAKRNEHLIQTAVQLTAFANTYLEAGYEGRGLMPKDVVAGYISLLADPSILPVWAGDKNQPIEGVNRRRIAEAVDMMLQTEADASLGELRELAREALTTTHTSILGTVTQGVDLVIPKWDAKRNRPYYELNEEAWNELGSYDTFGQPSRFKAKNDMKVLIEKLNNHPAMSEYGTIIMAGAHLNGTTRYAQAFDEEVLFGVLGIPRP